MSISKALYGGWILPREMSSPTKNLLFQMENRPVEIPKHFKHYKFTAYGSCLGEIESVAFIIGEMHYLALNIHLTYEEQQKLIENYWLEEFIPCRTAILGAYDFDTEEERELSERYKELFDQLLAADQSETHRNLLIDFDRIVAKWLLRESKNSFLAGQKDRVAEQVFEMSSQN